MQVCDLFAGIGGFSLGLQRAGMTIKVQVEIDDFCNRVLAKHWPDVQRFMDIRQVQPEEIGPVDVVCGGYPCQPFSQAGKRRGAGDDRHLWPEAYRLLVALRPDWCLFENVAGHVSMGLDDVLSDLERAGYACWPLIIPACAVNAPHRRDRVWIIGHTESAGIGIGQQKRMDGKLLSAPGRVEGVNNAFAPGGNAPDTCQPGLSQPERETIRREGRRQERRAVAQRNSAWAEPWLEVATRLCRVDARVPRRVDRLRALGNSVVPQVVEQIGRAIMGASHAD
jgi:DNA (cytosine-5)-methyltransferase 1